MMPSMSRIEPIAICENFISNLITTYVYIIMNPLFSHLYVTIS